MVQHVEMENRNQGGNGEASILIESSSPSSSPYYKAWLRIVEKSCTKLEISLQQIIYWIIFVIHYGSVVGLLIVVEVNPGEKQTKDFISKWLYLGTYIFIFVILQYNRERAKNIKEVLINIFKRTLFLFKPTRYFLLHKMRNKVRKILQQERSHDLITKAGIQKLAKLNAKELEEKRIEMLENFLHGIPMCLFLAYHLKYMSFDAHHLISANAIQYILTVLTIVTSLFQIGRSASIYETAKIEYEQALHILACYTTDGEHPMVVYPTNMFSLLGTLNLWSHVFTTYFRVFVTILFMKISLWYAALYLVISFISHVALLKIFPGHLQVHQNAPYGVFTTPNYFGERLINLFDNIGTRYLEYSHLEITSPFLLKLVPNTWISVNENSTSQRMFRITCPLFIIPMLQNLITIGITCLAIYFIQGYHATVYNFEVSSVVLVPLFVIYFFFTWAHAIVELRMRKKCADTEKYFMTTYPILTCYSFYSTLLNKVEACGVTAIKKLMILTLVKSDKFYDLYSNRKFSLSDENIGTLQNSLIDKLKEFTDDQILEKIRVCENAGHRFLLEFMKLKNILINNASNENDKMRDLRLFLLFFAYFDNKAVQITSDRIVKVFEIMKLDVEKDGHDWGRLLLAANLLQEESYDCFDCCTMLKVVKVTKIFVN